MINPVKLSTITCLSPLDGRYAKQLGKVSVTFSALNLTLMRLTVEIEWLKTLANEPKIKEIKPLGNEDLEFLHNIISRFDVKDMERIKELEAQTNHDIKAIEYFLKEKLAANKKNKNLNGYQEFIHFGCTSDDINNLSYATILSKTRYEILLPTIKQIILQLEKMASDHAATPMLARTHGQPASPTTFGKEVANFSYRLNRQFILLSSIPILGKFSGAVGNFNAHLIAYPEIAWQKIGQKFVEKFGLNWNPYTTQIEPHDWIAEYCDTLARFNTILTGFCHDIWGYTALGYLKQKTDSKNGIGSSTMPHKINPIDFENAEGNLGMANALLRHFSDKLPISRWQRDLTDSTVMRNLGVAIGHSVLAYKSLQKGLSKLAVNNLALQKDLNAHWEVLAEAIQTVMRRYKIAAPYEQLKTLTQGKTIDQQTLQKFILKLNIPNQTKQQLLKLTPENYLGKAVELAKNVGLIIKSKKIN